MKRFIAGAKCPECNAIDSICVYQADDDEILECVECGYTETMKETLAKDAAKAAPAEEDVAVIQFVDVGGSDTPN